MAASPLRILLVSGSQRAGSTNAALLRTAAEVAPAGVSTAIYEGLAELPHFNPDDDEEGKQAPAAVATMRAELERADAVLFSTPEYAGALPGSFKNLLEWSVGGHEIYRLPVAWVNAAAPGRGIDAEDSLRKVLGYVGADIAERACVAIPVARDSIGAEGTIADAGIRAALVAVLSELAAHVERRRADPDWY
jgi:chromate reductase, NAD(P)H dehydrogenase (quinone)